ncbi:MAG: NTP transferase domain-containing protein [Acidobacteria bacterium]|nr:NTP transferase domain-containing protein [Acidobacteriota bacterium]
MLDATGWDDILEASGINRKRIAEAAGMIMSANKIITCWAMGVTQHREAVATIQDIVNLHLLRGSIGKPGAGLCPVRGHSNVQGDRTMGIWEQMNPTFRANLEKEFNFKTPEKDGLDTVASIAAMRNGSVKVFFAMGGNFAAASPDTEVVESAVRNCDLTVNVLTKLNRTAVMTGKTSLILPCLGRSEIDRNADTLVRTDVASASEQLPGKSQAVEKRSLADKGVRAPRFVSTESTMLNVQSSQGIFEPASEHLRSEPWIVSQLAKATLGENGTVDWDAMAADYDNIRDAISRVVPGCENYNERIRTDGGFYMPNPPREGVFKTPTGNALFKSAPLEKIVLERGRLLLTTIRSHGQFNTTIYNFRDRYRGIDGSRRVVFMNEKNIAELGLESGQPIDITSHFDDGEREVKGFTVVPYEIPVDCCAAYFPEANPLVPLGSTAKRSNTPTSKCIIVSIKPTGRNTSSSECAPMSIEAFILIGGRSTRLGRDKAAVSLGGSPMVFRIGASIRGALDGVLVRLVAADERQLLALSGLDTLDGFVFDIYQGRGPAGGLHAALANTDKEWAFIAACDIPLISADLIRCLADKINDSVDAVVPVQPDGRLQPLAAFYRVKIVRERLEESLERARPAPSMKAILDGLRVLAVDFEEIKNLPGAELLFTNVNSCEDLSAAEERLRTIRTLTRSSR